MKWLIAAISLGLMVSASSVAFSDEKELDALINDAQNDYVHGAYANAVEKARKVVTSKSATEAQLMKSWRVIGTSSCFLKRADDAAAASNHLNDKGKQLVEFVCDRNGIKLPKP